MDYVWNTAAPGIPSGTTSNQAPAWPSYNWKASAGWVCSTAPATTRPCLTATKRHTVRGNDYNAYTNANFNIYGIRNFKKGWLKSLRHIVTPNAGISFNLISAPIHASTAAGPVAQPARSANLNLRWTRNGRSSSAKTIKDNDVQPQQPQFGHLLNPSAKPFQTISHTALSVPVASAWATSGFPAPKRSWKGFRWPILPSSA